MKRIGILTGGGDVPPLNRVIAAAAGEASVRGCELLGFLRGWRGVLEKTFVRLDADRTFPGIGGTMLKSSRVNIAKAEGGPERVRRNLEEIGLAGLIVIGGEDTLSNTFRLRDVPQVMISKTIDNDVGTTGNSGDVLAPETVLNYFTLGFPTAAERIVSFVSLAEGVRTTAYSHERIVVVEAMGMGAGWLALASGLGDPDLVVIPEFPVDPGLLEARLLETYARQRNAVIVVAEGARWADGSYLKAGRDENEDFGHPRFGGAADALRDFLKARLAGRLDTRNINAVNPSYLYRSGAPNGLDAAWAEESGRAAVRFLDESGGASCFLAVRKTAAGFRLDAAPLSDFDSIAALHRKVDARFYDPTALALRGEGERYLREIVRARPADRAYLRGPGGESSGTAG